LSQARACPSRLKSDASVISSFDYDYDKIGNRTSVVEADCDRVTYSYDKTYQLTEEHGCNRTSALAVERAVPGVG